MDTRWLAYYFHYVLLNDSQYREYVKHLKDESSVLLMFESLFARDERYHAAFGMNVFTVALEAAIRAVRIDRPCIVSLYR